MHYIIIVIVVLLIVAIQIIIYSKTVSKVAIFGDIFPKSSDALETRQDKEKDLQTAILNASDIELKAMLRNAGLDKKKFMYVQRTFNDEHEPIDFEVFDSSRAKAELKKNINIPESILVEHKNVILQEIVASINNYLANNKGNVSDFHLMKDIVDRNCDAAEEEISAQIPVPLYLGLVGTMSGILVGIGYLWISGDLNALLSSSSETGAGGVNALLGGVALAMISSILGILLTTIGSMKAKTAKSSSEKNKHTFLSWIQANLLPTLSNDTARSIERMSQNLVSFNRTFSDNTEDLRKTLSQVNQATVMQKQLLDAVAKINDKKLVVQNLELYNLLLKSTGEIEKLASFLHDSTEYLNEVRKLNENLDKDDKRAKAIEEMLSYFKEETMQIEQRKLAVSKAVGEIDDKLDKHLRELGDHASANVDHFYQALGKQQDALQSKLDETQVLISELKNLSSIKDSLSKFEKATQDQNRKIDALTRSIEKLAEAKSGGTPNGTPLVISKPPLWRRILLWGGVSLVVLLLLILLIANWLTIYLEIVNLFRF